MMNRLKHKNPFAMGNLDDLMHAQENNDVEYLKEWSKKAVESHSVAKDIQLKVFERLIQLSKDSSNAVEEIKCMLKETA